MKIPGTSTRPVRSVLIMAMAVMGIQHSIAQSYLNLHYTNNTDLYSLITDVKSITFDESGGIVVKKTDNSVTTQSLTSIKSITLDATTGGGSPLPVELVTFTATRGTGGVRLQWSTAAERNNYGFEIERAPRPDRGSILHWSTVGFVEGNGTSSMPKEYGFTDKAPASGPSVFRLKQIDRDGTFGYSDVIEVQGETPLYAFCLSPNFPNPFNPTTVISYQLSARSHTTVVVYDALGRVAATLVNGMMEPGSYSVQFEGSRLSSGIYFAKLTSGGRSAMIKLLLMK